MNYINTGTSTSTDDFKYGYDADGNVLYKVNGVNSSFSEIYTYDNLNRLTSFARGTLNTGITAVATANTLPNSSQSWSLDAIGNQLSVTTDGTTTSNTQNSQNELTASGSSSLTYDHDGNTLIDQNGSTYTYNAWNQIVSVKNSSGTTIAAYTYDGQGRRITETEGGVATDIYFDNQGQAVEERQGSIVTKQYVWNIDYVNDLLLQDDNSTYGSLGKPSSGLGERLYVQHDANYKITALVDNSGDVVQRSVYTPYGVPTVLTASWASASTSYGVVYGFQGGRMDLVTGLTRFGIRDLKPRAGVWFEQDPAGYVAGASRYQLEIGNPAIEVDPSGLAPIDFIGAGNNHFYPLYLGGSNDQPVGWLDAGQHQAFHQYLEDQDLGFFGGNGGDARSAWGAMSSEDQWGTIFNAAESAGLTDSQMGALASAQNDIMGGANPGFKTARGDLGPSLWDKSALDDVPLPGEPLSDLGAFYETENPFSPLAAVFEDAPIGSEVATAISEAAALSQAADGAVEIPVAAEGLEDLAIEELAEEMALLGLCGGL